MGGSIVSHVVLGAPDVIVLTLTELRAAPSLRASVAVPIVVDGDHGYGNALNVMRTVQELDSAGAGAVMIEDTLLRHGFGPSEAPQLLSLDESIGKIRAAVHARRFRSRGARRTSAASISSVDDAIVRLKAFESTEGRWIDVAGAQDPRRSRPPVIGAATSAGPGRMPESMCDECISRVEEFALVERSSNVQRRGEGALRCNETGTGRHLASNLPATASKELMNSVTGAADYKSWTKQFLGGE
jgi:carboxyvinyl-carboxyphosphonate phosphorylmutase